MEKEDAVTQKIIIPDRGSLSSHRGYDVVSVSSFADNIKHVCNFLLGASKMEIPVSDGNKYWVTDQPGDPKIISVENFGKKVMRLVGNIEEYKNTHGDNLPDLSQGGEFSDRFSAIVAEIVGISKDILTMDHSGKKRGQLKSSDGLQISMDSLEHPFGISSAPITGSLFLSSRQNVFAKKRDDYLKFLKEEIKKQLLPHLIANDFLKDNEHLEMSFLDDYPDGGKFAKFTIVPDIVPDKVPDKKSSEGSFLP